MQRAVRFNGIAIASVKAIDYRIHVWGVNKDEVINVLKNSDVNEKSGSLKITKKLIFLFLITKEQK